MITILVLATAASAAAAIVLEALNTREPGHAPAFYLLKPLTTVLIIALALLAPVESGERYRNLIVAGLVLSLAGDIALMFHGSRAFMAGLSSFLVAHVLFIAALADGVGWRDVPVWALVLPAFGVAMAMRLLPRAGPLKIPVILYGLVLVGMGLAAAARLQAGGGAAATAAFAGAVLFLLSDSLLGTRQFIGSYRGAQAAILSTYWLAIGLLAWSA